MKMNTKNNYKRLERDDAGHFLPRPKKIAKFKYNSPTTGIRNRIVELEEINKDYIIGADYGDRKQIKTFRADRVVDGVIHITRK